MIMNLLMDLAIGNSLIGTFHFISALLVALRFKSEIESSLIWMFEQIG